MRITLFSLAFLMTFLLTLVSAYGSDDEASPAATVIGSASGVTKWTYACADGKSFDALYYPLDLGRATVSVAGETIEMTREPSGSGTSYSGGSLTLRTKGTDALIQQGDVTLFGGCTGKQA